MTTYTPIWCSACHMYMGLVDTMTGEPLGEMAHLPRCVFGPSEEAEDEVAALRAEVIRLREELDAVG